MGARSLLILLLEFCLCGTVAAQSDYMVPGETEPHELPDISASTPDGWSWRFQMGGHAHLQRDAFWNNRYFDGDSETRVWLSWDLGRVYLNRDLDGWGGGVFAWIAGDYGAAWGLKGYRRRALGRNGKGYLQVGPGLVLKADAGFEQDYRSPGYLVELEVGTGAVALSSSLTFMPYRHRGQGWRYDGQQYREVIGDEGLDVAWNLGLKAAGPLAGITSSIFLILAYLVLEGLSNLD